MSRLSGFRNPIEEPVHEACEKLLKAALEGFLSVETARTVINKEKRKKRAKAR